MKTKEEQRLFIMKLKAWGLYEHYIKHVILYCTKEQEAVKNNKQFLDEYRAKDIALWLRYKLDFDTYFYSRFNKNGNTQEFLNDFNVNVYPYNT